MTNQVIALIAFFILVAAVVLIFLVAARRILSFDDNVRAWLSQQLPPADVNYLLSTDSVDTNSVESLMYLADRIRSIRSPFMKGKSVRNAELWIVINLIISEQRAFQQKTRITFRLLALFVFISLFMGTAWVIISVSR
jgi:hypothetical protein